MFRVVGLLFVGGGFGLIVGWALGFRMGQDDVRSQGFPRSRRFHR